MDKVSVIVPVYNVQEQYLKTCIESLISQTYNDLEIILVDDGSPDNCGDICEKYALQDKRIKVIHQINQGVSGARNRGIKEATGRWIAFVDSDDWIEPDMFQKAIEVVEKENVDLVVWNLYKNTQEEEKIQDSYKKDLIIRDVDKLEELNLSLLRTIPMRKDEIWIPTMNSYCVCHLYKLNIIRENDLFFDHEIKQGEDRLFNYMYHMHIETLAYLNFPGYHYRLHSQSATHKFFEKNIENSNLVNKRYYEVENKIKRDIRYTNAYNIRVAHVALMMIRKYYIHPDNHEKCNKVISFKKFVEEEPYKECIKKLDLSEMELSIVKIKLWMLKYHFYRGLFWEAQIGESLKKCKRSKKHA